MRRFLLDRRTVLRGSFGASLALPLLEPMLGCGRRARAAEAGPRRYFIGFCGLSLGADGDPVRNEVAPATVGPGYDPSTKTGIAPLARDDLARSVTIVSGLNIPMFTGARGQVGGGFHGGNASPLLSGVSSGSEAGTASVNGITSDQVVANALGKATRFPSLQVCVQPSGYSGGPANGWIMSWAGKGQPQKPVVSPQLLYRTLFMGFQAPSDAAALAAFEREKRVRLRVLDAVKVSRERLARRLGRGDLQILDEYYEHVRTIENGLAGLSQEAAGVGCAKPADPGADPAVGANTYSSMQNNGFAPPGTGWSNETLRADVFAGLIAAAFKCDLTRVASMVITRNQCFMAGRNIVDDTVRQDVHSLSHYIGGKPSTRTLSRAVAWHVGIFGRLVKLLRDARDATGKPLLSSSALALVFEGGHGSNPRDVVKTNSAHSTYNMCMLVAGGAGGLKQGHHIVAPAGADHPANVLVGLMNAVGVPAGQLGEISGALPGLTA
jgi:hypothetical protein